ncbi:phage scaffolding protein [Oscillospiraceae bacterium LTW-04]|nr:phage scaffolding protein [Oscillospiraceae bacterium MB24-C1]
MEQLKQLFGEKALTYGEFETALQGCKDLKLANLAGGQYVDKAKFAQLEVQLTEAKSGREADAKAFGEQLTAQKKDAGIAQVLIRAQAKNLTAAKALLRLDEIVLDGDTLTGIDEQLEAVMRENPFLFGGAQGNPPPPANGGVGFVSDDTAKWRLEAGLPIAGQ